MENALENLPLPGEVVMAREWRWFVQGHERGRACAMVLVEPHDEEAPRLRALLLPFDRCRLVPSPTRLRSSPLAGCTRRLADLIPTDRGALVPAVRATFDILPFQLAPAMALMSGAISRVLIADEVGLGKTIQAGLVLHALRQRGLGDRCLMLVPAGLREQWRQELTRRFRVSAECADAAAVAHRAIALPPGVSPWRRAPVQIVSIDYARQLDVLAGLSEVCWDLVVIDEAHHVAGQTARAAAARILAHRARHLVLLSATPHTGDDRAFAALCDLGRLGRRHLDPLAWFRRTPRALGLGGMRRSRVIRVRQSATERALLDRLERYARAIERNGTPQAQLAMIVLRKRALSSPAALAASLAHRLAALGAPTPVAQMPLPLEPDEDGDAAPVLAAAGPGASDDECDSLRALLAAAEAAAADADKLRWVERLLRRTREPAIVFTEYRDTLSALARRLAPLGPALLHGGLDPEDRADAIRRFTSGTAPVLLATDAAGEGLNLQARCRLVVHFELPWSPTRLEQRAGRIDRIGQHRRVHVWHLLGRHGAERRVLDRLAARADSIRRAIGAEFSWLAPELTAGRPLADALGVRAGLLKGDAFDGEEAECEARLLRLVRRLLPPVDSRGTAPPRGIPWTRLRPFRKRQLVPGVVFIFSTRAHPLRADRVAIVHVALSLRPPRRAAALLAHLRPLAEAAITGGATDPADIWLRRLADRERALLAHLDSSRRRAWQPALFDRRAARAFAAAADRLDRQRREHQARLARLSPPLPVDAPRLVAALVLE